MNIVVTTELSVVNDKVDTLGNDYERRLVALEAGLSDADAGGRGGARARTSKGKAKGARSVSAGAYDNVVMGGAALGRSGSRGAVALPISRSGGRFSACFSRAFRRS